MDPAISGGGCSSSFAHDAIKMSEGSSYGSKALVHSLAFHNHVTVSSCSKSISIFVSAFSSLTENTEIPPSSDKG